jgi:hypothetical protein
MIEIFRDVSSVRVGHFQSVLEEQGISTFIRNNNLSVVEVPIPVFYPALCIMNEEDHERAIQILREIIQREQSNDVIPEIYCPSCNETNPANFETCWSCEGELNPN